MMQQDLFVFISSSSAVGEQVCSFKKFLAAELLDICNTTVLCYCVCAHESLEECLAEVQQEAPSQPGFHVAEQDVTQLVSHASAHSVNNSVHVGSQTVGEGGESVPSPPPVTLAEEQTADAPIVGDQPPMIGRMDGQNMRESPTSVVSVEGSDGHPTSPSMLQQVTQLLQAQRDMMATQIEAIATNSVPPLHLFSGDDVHTDDGSFD